MNNQRATSFWTWLDLQRFWVICPFLLVSLLGLGSDAAELGVGTTSKPVEPSPVFYGTVIAIRMLDAGMKVCFDPRNPDPFLSVVTVQVEHVYAGSMDKGECEVLSRAGFTIVRDGRLGVLSVPSMDMNDAAHELLLPGVTGLFVLGPSQLNACGSLSENYMHLQAFEHVLPAVRTTEGVLYIAEIREDYLDALDSSRTFSNSDIRGIYGSRRGSVTRTDRIADVWLLDRLEEFERRREEQETRGEELNGGDERQTENASSPKEER